MNFMLPTVRSVTFHHEDTKGTGDLHRIPGESRDPLCNSWEVDRWIPAFAGNARLSLRVFVVSYQRMNHCGVGLAGAWGGGLP
ncbi:MAG TPA: hypothetical protein VIM52_14105, partial [Stellaceae bacterium]